MPTSWYLDVDGDGWGAGDPDEACEPPSGSWAEQDGDCDDGDAATYPGARWEPCGEGVDRNCDGSVNGDGGECDLGWDADWAIVAQTGADGFTWPGMDAAWVGDVVGDRRDDVGVGAPGSMCMNENVPGYARVYTAPSFDAARDLDAETDATFTIESVHDGWCFGSSVAGAGDVDGDGLDDLVVGEPAGPSDYDYYSNPDPGNVYVFLAAELQRPLTRQPTWTGTAVQTYSRTRIFRESMQYILGRICRPPLTRPPSRSTTRPSD